jgi:hypothetical protein
MSRAELLSRAASVIVAIVLMTFALARAVSEGWQIGLGLMIALTLIWFPEWLGDAIMRPGGPETPPALISMMGWFLLVGIPLILWALS